MGKHLEFTRPKEFGTSQLCTWERAWISGYLVSVRERSGNRSSPVKEIPLPVQHKLNALKSLAHIDAHQYRAEL